jgi:hypothetical protein
MHELTVEHQVAYPTSLNLAPNALPPPYVPPTSVEKDDMYTGTDPAMTACREGISTINVGFVSVRTIKGRSS